MSEEDACAVREPLQETIDLSEKPVCMLFLRRPVTLFFAIVVAVTALSISRTPASATDRLFHVLQFNACDAASHCSSQSSHNERAEAIAQSILDWSATVVYINEICLDTTDEIRTRLAGRGYALMMRIIRPPWPTSPVVMLGAQGTTTTETPSSSGEPIA